MVDLTNDKILERWNVLIHEGAGRSEQLYDLMQEYLTAAMLPGVSWEMTTIMVLQPATRTSPARRVPHQHLAINHATLKEYPMYILAYDYGTLLAVVWALAIETGFFNKSFAKLAPGIHALTNAGLSVSQQMELGAYSSAVHDFVKQAVKVIMDDLNQDFSKVNTRSKGILELW
jgi:hypothetical protein